MAAPRYAQAPDRNQPEIVSALEKIGCSVYDASRIGGGFTDLVVGYQRCNILMEVKMPKGKLRPSQKEFMKNWQGYTCVVRSPEEAIEKVLAYVKNHPIR